MKRIFFLFLVQLWAVIAENIAKMTGAARIARRDGWALPACAMAGGMNAYDDQ